MKIKIFITSLIFISSYFLGQTYQLFDNDYYNKIGNVNWIWLNPKPMPISWNVKFLSEEISRLIEAIGFFYTITYLTKEKLLHILFISYLTYRLLDVGFWFLDFKTHRYWIVFAITTCVEVFYYYKHDLLFNFKKHKK